MKPYERWLYPSLAIWLAALSWLAFEVWPNWPILSAFDVAVELLLSGGAFVSALVAWVLSRRT